MPLRGDLSGRFPVILWILPPIFTASFLHPDPPLSPQGTDFLKSFRKSILAPSAIVLLYNMVLTTTSKRAFLPLSLLFLATLCDHMFMYVGLFIHSADCFFMFYVGLLIVQLSFMSDSVLFID